MGDGANRVVNAYLNSPLDVTVDMRQPPYAYFEELDKNVFVCKLMKSLYGLKQSGRNWNHLLHDCLMSMGFSHCKDSDPCVYVLRDNMIVGIYVDDILIIGSRQAIDRFKNDLSSKMKIKDIHNIVTSSSET